MALIEHPKVRRVLWDLWRQAKHEHQDPVEAWSALSDDAERIALYIAARGHGEFVDVSWDDVLEICAAAHVATVGSYGPDRVAGFGPAPADSLVSQAAGSRYLALTGGVQLSYYDWDADVPPGFAQAFGEQADTPESTDMENAGFLLLWGAVPSPTFLDEAPYREQRVMAVFDEHRQVQSVEETLLIRSGEDAALAMAMGHVILKEFFVEKQTPYFFEYAKTYTDLPFLVILEEHDGAHVPSRFLTAADLGDKKERAAWQLLVFDRMSAAPVVPNGCEGSRWSVKEPGKWNLRLDGIDPALTFWDFEAAQVSSETVEIVLPRFDVAPAVVMHRSVPAIRVGEHLVTTVFDLLLAQYGVRRGHAPGDWPRDYDDDLEPFTPAWQQRFTGISAEKAAHLAREFAENAQATRGRSMIATGSGLSHWHNADLTYRAIITLLAVCGCVGVSGGGLAQVDARQEVLPLAGWTALSAASDWVAAPRQSPATSWFYLTTDQWRYETMTATERMSPLASGLFRGMAPVDALAQAARLGWQIPHPAFDQNPLTLAREAAEATRDGGFLNDYVAAQVKADRLRFAAEDPDDPSNWPRVLFVWKTDLLGPWTEGYEYFLRHMVGARAGVLPASEVAADKRPRDVRWHEQPPVGKLDLLVVMDALETSSAMLADVVLPLHAEAGLSARDMHLFAQGGTPESRPEARSAWTAFSALAAQFSKMAASRLGEVDDLVAVPLNKDTPAEASQPRGQVQDWRSAGSQAVPGRTMPAVTLVKRNYTGVHEMYTSLGPRIDTVGCGAKGLTWRAQDQVELLGRTNGTVTEGVGSGRPSVADDLQAAEAMLILSASTNRQAASDAFGALGRVTGDDYAELLPERLEERITESELEVGPRRPFPSPEWSGEQSPGKPHTAFALNVDRLVPWRTLTGRIQNLIDHDWFKELGELLPGYHPPLSRLELEQHNFDHVEPGVALRYVDSEEERNLPAGVNMLHPTAERDDLTIWMSPDDALAIAVSEADAVELSNRNGSVKARVIISPGVPRGLCRLYRGYASIVAGNPLMRILLKPTHMVGGYAHLSYATNYYGCMGAQRDQYVTVRSRRFTTGHEGNIAKEQ